MYSVQRYKKGGSMEKVQMTLRIPREVYEALEKEAREKNISINELILLKINPIQVDFQQSQ